MSDFDDARQRYHRALEVFIHGDAGPVRSMWSRREDVTLANPLGPPVRGWDAVRETMNRAASQLADGEAFSVECIATYATADLGFELAIERCRVKVGGADVPAPTSLRVTNIFRREENGWKVVHRHADPITGARPAESIVQS